MTTSRILVGDCIEMLATLPDDSVHCVVTSPPFWQLRDYKVPPTIWPAIDFSPMPGLPPVPVGAQTVELGLELDPWAFVGHIVHVFRQVRRVLRPDGTLWLNMGDTYASSGRGGGGSYMAERGDASWRGKSRINGFRSAPAGMNRKDMMGMPWRIAFALQADGWVLRAENVLHKIAAMPESVQDRPTKAHEPVFLFAKGPRYYYDPDAVREPVTGGAHTRGGGVGGKTVPPGRGQQGRVRNNESFGSAVRELVTSRNLRSVWEVRPEAYAGDHHATFGPSVPRRCILAGSSAAGCCSACGAPYRRRIEVDGPSFNEQTKGREPSKYAEGSLGNPHSYAVRGSHNVIRRVRRTVGWQPSCECGVWLEYAGRAATVPCTVLDPFAGSGTTGAVAVTHGRGFVGIELSAGHAAEALDRIAAAREAAGLATVEEPGREPVQLGLLGPD